MFWGLIMEPGKRYAQTVDKSFHVSMACLEPNSTDNDYVPLMLDIDNQEYILCNLHKHKTIQSQLDLNFRTGNKIAFFSSGKSRIHLTGYLIEDEDDNLDLTGDMSDLEDEEEEEETSPVKQAKKVANALQSKRKSDGQLSKPETKKAKLNQISQDESDEDDDDDEDEDEDDALFPDSDESDDEAISGEDSDEEDDDSDDMAPTQVQKTPESKKDKLKKMSMDKMNKTPVDKHNQLNKTKTPVENQEQKKKKKSLNKESVGVETPKTPTNEANGSFPTPHPSKKKNKKANESPVAETPKAGNQTPGTPGGGLKKTLQGGVFVQDLKLGDGQVAKAGKKVTVYYVGRLKQNNKEFDSTNSGSGFKFELGRGEVIKGWDIGVAGMRVGGKRKIVCPPHMAYGNKGIPPTIPPNSALVFEVELRGVN